MCCTEPVMHFLFQADILFHDHMISLDGPHSIIGRSVNVHEGKKVMMMIMMIMMMMIMMMMMKGARIACGVIGIWEEEGDVSRTGSN